MIQKPKMNTLRLLSVSFLVLASVYSGLAQNANLQKKIDKGIAKGEAIYEYGEYFSARRKVAKARKKVAKSGLTSTQSYAVLALYEAKYIEAIGNIYEALDSIENATFYFNLNVPEDSSRHLEALVQLAETYKQYGNYIKAYELTLKAKEYFQEKSDMIGPDLRHVSTDTLQEKKKKSKIDHSTYGIPVDTLIQNRLNQLELEIQMNRGFYRESLKKIDDLISFQAGITRRKFPVSDSTSKKKFVKIKKKEYRKRYEELATLMVMRADFNRLRGDYKQAATYYNDNAIQFENKKLKLNSLPYIRNDFGRSIMAENDGVLEKPSEEFHQLRNRIQKSGKISNYHKFYNEVTEKEIDSWIREEKFEKAEDMFLAYKLENRSKYGSKNVHFLRALMLENALANRNKRYKVANKKEQRLMENLNTVVPPNHISKLDFNEHFYEFYHKNHKVEEALIEREDNVEVAKVCFGPESPRFSMEEVKLADFYIENEDEFTRSKELYSKHFDDLLKEELHPFHPEYTTYLTMYARLKEYLDQFDGAKSMLDEALSISGQKYGQSSKEYGLALVELGKFDMIQGDYAEAEKKLEQGSELIKEAGSKKSVEYYESLRTLAQLYAINGKYELSRSTLKKAHKYLKKSGEITDDEIGNSEEMAQIFIETGRYKAAEEILNSSIEMVEKKYGMDHYKLVDPLRLSGKLNLIQGEYIEAEKQTNRAIDISRANLGDTSTIYMDNLAQLAEIYTNMGNYKDAKVIYDQNLILIRNKFGLNNIREVPILRKLAETNFRSEDADLDTINALLDYAKDIVVSNFTSNHPQYADIVEYQGKVLMLFGKYFESEAHLKEAQKIWLDKFGKNHPNSANNLVLTGDLKYLQENYVEAQESYESAAKSYKSIFNDEHPQYLKARSSVARTLYAQDELKAAKAVYDETTEKYLVYLKDYFPALSEKEKGNYWNSIKGDFEAYNSLAIDLSLEHNNKALGNVYNFRLSTKAVLLSSTSKLKERIANSGDGDLVYRYQLYNQKKALLTKSLSMSSAERENAGINVPALEKEINRLEKELSEESEDFAKAFEDEQYTWKDVKKNLNENEYAVEIIRFRHFENEFTDSILYAALIVHKKTKKGPELVLLSDGNKLDGRYFPYYRNVMKLDRKDKYSYGKFWKDIDARIPDGAVVYLSADGLYNQMNVETLVDDDGKFVIDKNEIYNLSNTKDLVIARGEGIKQIYDSRTAALFGNPSFAGNAESIDMSNKVSSIEPLPGAEKEIKTVTKLLARSNYRYKTLLGDEATETAVKKVNSPRIFHVATHGFFMQEDASTKKREELTGDIVDNPLLRSGLLFVGAGELLANNNVYEFNKSDGILTAYEAMNLNLDNTELVILSACETGLGEIKSGEGVYGLQRSFLVAGAQNVIMTLFKVNDKVTQELMSDFYSNWLETGQKRASFDQAKKRIKEKYKSPKLWGSFVLIGLD